MRHKLYPYLSPKKKVIVQMVALGYSNAVIAEKIGRTEATVAFHLCEMYKTFAVDNRIQLVNKLRRVKRL